MLSARLEDVVSITPICRVDGRIGGHPCNIFENYVQNTLRSWSFRLSGVARNIDIYVLL